jgi:tRNA dimethylallyltransferase
VRIREQLWSECQGSGRAMLYDRLQGVDAVAASRIHPNDARRIIRALEVYALTGKPISSWWRQASAELLQGQVTILGINRDREVLYQRINDRLLHMVYEEGVINEVRRLLRLPLSRTARQVHGLADIEQYLAGRLSLKEMIAIWQQRVRNYARRQLIWFRQTPDIQWLDIAEDEPPWETAERLRELIRRQHAPQQIEVSS